MEQRMLTWLSLSGLAALWGTEATVVVVQHWGNLAYTTQELAVARWTEATTLESDNFFLRHDRNLVDNNNNYTVGKDFFAWGAVDPLNSTQSITAKMYDFKRPSMNCLRSKCEYSLVHTFHSELSVCLHLDQDPSFYIYWDEQSCKSGEEKFGAESIEACVKVSNAFAEYCAAFLACFVEGEHDARVCRTVARHVEDRVTMINCPKPN